MKRFYYITSRILQALLVFSFIYALYTENYMIAFLSLITLALAFAPIFIKKRYNITLPLAIELIIVLILYLNIIGLIFNLYNKFFFFSSLMHFLMTAMIALLAYIIVFTLNLTKQVKLSNYMIGFFTVILALAIGTVWEIFEFSSDSFLGTSLQGDYGRSPITDTMLDLIWDGIAGVFVAIIAASTNWIKDEELIRPFARLFNKEYSRKKWKKFWAKVRKKLKS